MCGENNGSELSRFSPTGSSPRVRGKRAGGVNEPDRDGLIPACAGKTGTRKYGRNHAWAHPRVCGENGLLRCARPRSLGSSPRVRGKPFTSSSFTIAARLIPACAGKTAATRRRKTPRRAHPRVCGENGGRTGGLSAVPGSSPRVRGKRIFRVGVVAGIGLIPACAGKTVRMMSIASRAPAHPRVCGENRTNRSDMKRGRGSSPRVRGKQPQISVQDPHTGLIPACAGKTNILVILLADPTAHPRVCGENQRYAVAFDWIAGSSPRVRGKHAKRVERVPRGGLIPACAGKTCRYGLILSKRKAHPRVCGENV